MNFTEENLFIENFKHELQNSQAKDFLIEHEKNQVLHYTTNRLDTSIHPGELIRKKRTTDSVFDLSEYFFQKNYIIDSFQNYLLGKDQINNSTIEKYNNLGIQFAKYYLWLNELKKPKPKEKFSNLNNEQKLLALHFLFPNLTDYNKRQLSLVLGKILNIGSENIRRNFSDLNKKGSRIRSLENFEKLLELFENKEFESITSKLEREIKQLS